MQKIFLISLLLSVRLFANSMGASLNINPNSLLINQKMGASLVIYNYSGGSSVNVMSINPQVWVTVGGSSTVPMAWDKPALGPGQNVTVGPGSNLTFYYSGVFFSPSISPAYAGQSSPYGNGFSLVPAGTQTFSVGALVHTNDGSDFAASGQTVTVLPIPLPDAQLQ